MKVVQRIQSLSNPQLRRLKKLHKVQSDQQEFLIEGTHAIAEAIATQWPLISIYYTERWSHENSGLIKQVSNQTDKYWVDAVWLRQAATTENPDGVVAIANMDNENLSGKVLRLSNDIRDWSLVLMADGIQDPGNAGTLLRTLIGLGGNYLYLSPDSVSPVHPKFLRSTAGQWFRAPPKVSSVEDLAVHAKHLGAQVLVADMAGEAVSDIDLRKPTVFVLGSEGRGIRPAVRKIADKTCAIPMSAGVESLNVATTGAILLYEAQRQRLSKG